MVPLQSYMYKQSHFHIDNAAVPSSTTPTSTPCPVIPSCQTGSTFKSRPLGPYVCPVFFYIDNIFLYNMLI